MARQTPPLYVSALILGALILGLPVIAGLETTIGEGKSALNQAWNGKQIWQSVFTASTATLLSLIAALGLVAHFQRRAPLLTWLSLPLLALPHAAIAHALGLLFSPSGFLVRLLSPWATGYTRPPNDWLWDHHPDGWTLILALAIKEVPFLLILIYTYSASMPTQRWVRAGIGLGYSRSAAWWHLALPAILPRLILPLFVILAFSISVVDVAAIVGPSRLKTFAHGLQQAWQSDTPVKEVLAGATWLFALTVSMLITAWILLQSILKFASGASSWSRSYPGLGLSKAGAFIGVGIFISGYLSLALLPLQSIIETSGRRTHFPDLWTSQFGLNAWTQATDLALPTLPITLLIGALSTAFSLIFALWLLEGEARQGQNRQWLDTFLLIPLFVPQFAFLSGISFLGIKLGFIPQFGLAFATWFHILFVFPYVFLVLAPSYRGLDQHMINAGKNLGHGPNSLFWRLKLPVLVRPIAYAAAWGMAVSLALYLPTFFASGGRFETLLTVGVTQLAGKGDNVRAVWGLCLLMVPLGFFALAALVSSLQARNRRGLRV